MFDSKLSIRKVIYTNLDSVLGGLITSTMLKPKYGQVDIIHLMRAKMDPEGKLTDEEMLSKCSSDVISTCWSTERTLKAVRALKWTDVRVYELGKRVDIKA